jgi:hypothetical protein
VGAIVAHTQGIPQGSSNTRDEIIVARDDEVLFVHLVAAIILFYFSFLKFVVSILICYFFLVAFSFLKSGAHLVFIGIESPQRSRVFDESRCASRERERVYYG